MQPLTCPKCTSLNIRAFDNEPLAHPTKYGIENGMARIDLELYMKMKCDNCEHDWTKVFNLIPQ